MAYAQMEGDVYKGPVAPISTPAPAPATNYPTPDHSWITKDVLAQIGIDPTQGQATHQAQGDAARTAFGSPANGTSAVNPSPTAGNYGFDNDPGVAMARALENQGIGSLDAWLKSAREKAIIASGDPGLAAQAGFGLDPQAGVFAQQNYLSGNADLARVKRARDLAHQAIINRLAAHGILNSGELGYQEGQSNIDFGNQEYDVREGVLQKLSDFMKQYLDQKQALKQSTLGAYQQAYQNYASNPDLLAALGGQIPQQSASAPTTALRNLLNRFQSGE